MELLRQKNVATYIVFPLVDADGDAVSGATGLDSEIDEFSDGSAPTGFADCTNEATEIGSTGSYYLSLTQTEMNQDYLIIQIKSNEAKTQWILIRTIVGDPLNVATTDDNAAIDASALNTLSGHDPGENIMGTTDLDADIAALPTAAENRTEMDSNSTKLADIVADTNELQTDDTPAALANILDKLLGYVQLLARKDSAIATDRATELGEINANEGSGAGAYASTTDSQEKLSDDVASVQTTADNIETDTQDIQTGVDNIEAKLPTNYIMGSSDQTDKDDEIDAIKAVTDNLPNSGALTDIDTGVNNIEGKLPTNYIMGSSDQADHDGEIGDILTDTAEIGAAGIGLTEAGGTGDQLTAIPPDTVEGTIDMVEAMKVLLAFCAGESDGGGTATIHFRDQADTLNRITMTVDADGNRSAVVLNVT